MHRSIARAGVLAVATLSAVAAQAGLVRESAGPAVIRSPNQLEYGYRQELGAIRREMLAEQKADGGTLSPAHHDALQARLDRVNEFHHRALSNNNPLTVSPDGHPVRIDTSRNWTYAAPVLTGVVN